MTMPPHPDDVFAASLDALNATLAVDPVRVADVILAWQAVYAAGLNMVLRQIDQVQLTTGAQLEAIDAKLDRLLAPSGLARIEQRGVSAKDLHEVRNQLQQMMENTVLMRENQHAITVLYNMLEALTKRLDTIIEQNDLTERAVGEEETAS